MSTIAIEHDTAEQVDTDQLVTDSDAPAAEQAEALPGRYELIDVKNVIVNKANIREQATANAGIVANMKEEGAAGLIQPIVVVEIEPKKYSLIAGEGRLLSARDAGLKKIPAIIREDLGLRRDQIASMLKENVHRTDLTSAEVAAGIEQLQIEGLSVTGIMKKTGIKRAKVAQALTVAGMGEAKTAVAGLDIPQAATAAAFADDPKALARLVEAAKEGPDAFKKKVIAETQTKESAAKLAARTAELTAAKVTLLAKQPDTYNTPVQRVNALAHDGKALTAADHATCPGHAAYLTIRSWDGAVMEDYYCTDWKANKHKQRNQQGAFSVTGPLTDKEKAARKEVRENNAAMRVAIAFRHDWIRDNLMTRKTLPKGAALLIAELMVTEAHLIGRWMRDPARPLLAEFMGQETGSKVEVKATTDARCHIYSLAVIAAAHERELGPRSWDGAPNTTAARWLTFLGSLGYPIDPIEQKIIDKVTADAKKKAKAEAKAAAKAEAKTEPMQESAVPDVPAEPEPQEPDADPADPSEATTPAGEPHGYALGGYVLVEVDDAWHVIDPDGDHIMTSTTPTDAATAADWATARLADLRGLTATWYPDHTADHGHHLRAITTTTPELVAA
ncbi:hypothetical protein Lfu02_15200 [Longispora fulva]|uniref:ParB family chromosome partitioning protein n=1 Tax=Longispora fulva TaxID=619741 RepID=A0A8J7GMF9_9ACTN|nr:ParB/RepB/Spo0J family partition protein [Longispora fulva]MBG6140470.1 ParB family chromosome partitioning protein [Longispora fulva]GIG57148.1 hypothetical protein Lfu02_15200 [Longispora fulva]